MNRDDCRKRFNDNFSYSDIGSKELCKLKELLKNELEVYKNGEHYFNLFERKKNDLKYNESGTIKYAFLRVKGTWFDDREAISFNQDFFIGFAGWSDDKNIQPILKAFNNWIDWMLLK